MKLKKNIAISTSGFIFNAATGDSFSANPIALEVLEMMKKDMSAEEISSEVREKYAVDHDRWEEDFSDFTGHLIQINLLGDETKDHGSPDGTQRNR